jgi:regulator of cell morphogenesis and NO signaling
MLSDKLNVLKVYELEPTEKHPTIFRSFDVLLPGESFVIENDHDPIPLYYELEADRKGQLDKFEYLQKGPDIWVVQISKSEIADNQYGCCLIPKKAVNEIANNEVVYNSCTVNSEGILKDDSIGLSNSCNIENVPTALSCAKVLDVSKLPPKYKHSTIFEWFKDLKQGESFSLKNDHDPKPLYYQMLGELGSIFNWQYIQQGPKWWIVLIQKKLPGEPTIGELAAKDIRKAEAMKRLGIDFCCGGSKTVKQAVSEAGISEEEFNKAVSELDYSGSNISNSYDKWDADFLADYIYHQHHKYFYEIKDVLLRLSSKVKEVHGHIHSELLKLDDLIITLFNELGSHFIKEEKVLFPYIKEMAGHKKNNTFPPNAFDITQGPLALMHMEHEEAGDLLKTIRTLTNDYSVPGDACNSYRKLYQMLQELEGDLHQHIHLENNILFPKAIALANQFKH